MTRAVTTLAIVLSTGISGAEAPAIGQDDPDAWTRTPTRYLGKSEQHFVEAMKARLAITGRRTGPFGLPQDPSDEPQQLLTPRKKLVKRVERPFSEIVAAVPVSTVNIQERSFFVADRKFVKGQQFPIKTSQTTVKVRIDKIAANRIGFTNMKTGEYVEKRLDLLPEGVLPGNRTITVPGVTPDNQSLSAPLQIDIPSPVPAP